MPANRWLPALLILALGLTGRVGGAPDKHLVLGGEDTSGPLLLMPRQVEEGPDGNLYVLDTGDGTIKVYTPAGNYLRSLGGEGEGPGEFQRTDGATFGFTPDGLLLFTEFFGGHRWLTLLRLDGTLQSTVSPQLDTFFGVERAAALLDGRFLVQLALNSKTRSFGDVFLYTIPRILAVMDAEGNLGPDIVRTDRTVAISTSPDGGTSNLPFTPRFCWVLDGSGKVVWSEGLAPHLEVLDLQGNRMNTLPTALPPPKAVTRDDLDKWQRRRREMMMERNPSWHQRFGRAVETYDEALYPSPLLTDLSLTPAGGILVEGPSDPDADGIPYWLLAPDGSLVRQVRLPAWGLHLSAGHLLFFTSSDEGLTLVHAVAREGEEAVSLAGLEEILAGDRSLTD